MQAIATPDRQLPVEATKHREAIADPCGSGNALGQLNPRGELQRRSTECIEVRSKAGGPDARRSRAIVCNQVRKCRVRFMADRREHRQLGSRNRAKHRLVVEGGKVIA